MDKERIPLPAGGYELRECGCDAGYRYEPGIPSGRWMPCTDCKGAGERRVFAYSKRGTAKAMVRVLAGGCADCGVPGTDAELYPVPGEHLTFFAGDELCEDCAPRHGVL